MKNMNMVITGAAILTTEYINGFVIFSETAPSAAITLNNVKLRQAAGVC